MSFLLFVTICACLYQHNFPPTRNIYLFHFATRTWTRTRSLKWRFKLRRPELKLKIISIFIFLCSKRLFYHRLEKIYRNRPWCIKPDTNQLQYSLKTDTCPACPCPKSDSSAQLARFCCVGFWTVIKCFRILYNCSIPIHIP